MKWKSPALDRCVMGSPLGEEYTCWGEALPSGLWCASCQRDIDHDTRNACDCPGCSRDFMADVGARIDGGDERA